MSQTRNCHCRCSAQTSPRCRVLWLVAGIVVALTVAPSRSVVHAQEGYPQRTDPYVNDYAGLLTAEDAANIQTLFVDLENETGIEAVVVTIDYISDYTTGDETLESFATNLFNTWGIGDREQNDGVLILVAAGDRAVRIELGSGYGNAYNSDMQEVINEQMLPSFKRSDYSGGIHKGAQAVVSKLSGIQPQAQDISVPTPRPTRATMPPQSRSSTSSTDTDIPLIVILGGAIATLGAALGLPLYKRYRKRRCPNCQTYMARLDKASADTYLDEGQKLERALKSVDYDVWKCSNCGKHMVHSYERRSSLFRICTQCSYRTLAPLDGVSTNAYLDEGQKLEKALNSVDHIVWKCRNCGNHTVHGHERWSPSVERCPRCDYRTAVISTKTLVEPTYSSTGKRQITKDCRHCNYHKKMTETLPKLTPQPTYYGGSYSGYSSSSSSSSSSRSSSSGGGRSSGDGTSGKW